MEGYDLFYRLILEWNKKLRNILTSKDSRSCKDIELVLLKNIIDFQLKIQEIDTVEIFQMKINEFKK